MQPVYQWKGINFLNPTKIDSPKKDLQLISYDFSSGGNYCIRVNSTRKSYKLRKIHPLVSSKRTQHMITQNWFHSKILYRLGFKKALNSDLVVFCKNNHAKNKTLFATSQVACESHLR
jgi:hypothetical protein